MALRRVPIHRAGIRPHLLLGGDRELVMMLGLIVGVLSVGTMNPVFAVAGMALWVGLLFLLRLMAKADPRMRDVFLRERRYRGCKIVVDGVRYNYYPARSTPWRKS